MTRRYLLLLLSAALVFQAAGTAFAAGKKDAPLPKGAVLLDTSAAKPAGGKGSAPDSGLYSMLLDGETLWVGRAGGVRKYDAKTGQWKYYPAAACAGSGARTLAVSGGKLWALFSEDGLACVMDIATGNWRKPGDWNIKEHVRYGAIMKASGGQVAVTGAGGPDWEGVSIIDSASEKWLKLLKTKPVKALWADATSIWAGVTEGIARIDRAGDKYTYYLPSDYGCGAEVTAIVGAPTGVFAATKPAASYELGLKTKAFKDGIAVFSRREGQKYSYKWTYYKRSDRRKLTDDVTTASVPPREIKTPGGICRWNGSAWRGVFKKDGLPDNTVTTLAADSKYIYAGTPGGVAALDLQTLKVVKTIPQAISPVALAAAESGLWVNDGSRIYKIPQAVLAGKSSEAQRDK